MRPDLVRGNLEMLVLSVMAEGPGHGYAILEELRRRSGGEIDLPEGTVYPALYRLERAGRLASMWDEQGGRRRRVYRITPSGRRALEIRRREWSRFASTIARMVEA